jgi:hypothetical protein
MQRRNDMPRKKVQTAKTMLAAPPTPDPLDFFYSLCCLHAYQDDLTRLNAYYPAGADWSFGEFFKDSGTSTEAFTIVNRAKDQIVLAFRGTQETTDFVNDAKAMYGTPAAHPIGGKVNQVVYQNWQTISKAFFNWLATVQLSAPATVTVTGHSLGGALALIAAADVAQNQQVASTRIITFAAFPIGDTTYLTNLQAKVGANQIRSYLDDSDSLIGMAQWLLTGGRWGYDPNPGLIMTNFGGWHWMANYVACRLQSTPIELSAREFYSYINTLVINTATDVATAQVQLGGLYLRGNSMSSTPPKTFIIQLFQRKTNTPPHDVFLRGETDTFIVSKPIITPADIADGLILFVQVLNNFTSDGPDFVTVDTLELIADSQTIFFGGPGFGSFTPASDTEVTEVKLTSKVDLTKPADVQWTPPYTNNGNGNWLNPVYAPRLISGMAVKEENGYGLIDARLLYTAWGLDQESPWSTNNPNADWEYPWGGGKDFITQVAVREQTGYGVIDIMLTDDAGISSGWLAGNPNATSTWPNLIPAGGVLCAIQVKEQSGYGIIDFKFGYVML